MIRALALLGLAGACAPATPPPAAPGPVVVHVHIHQPAPAPAAQVAAAGHGPKNEPYSAPAAVAGDGNPQVPMGQYWSYPDSYE